MGVGRTLIYANAFFDTTHPDFLIANLYSLSENVRVSMTYSINKMIMYRSFIIFSISIYPYNC